MTAGRAHPQSVVIHGPNPAGEVVGGGEQVGALKHRKAGQSEQEVTLQYPSAARTLTALSNSMLVIPALLPVRAPLGSQ